MSGPRNNLDDLRRRQAVGTPASSPKPESSTQQKFSRFKPSKSFSTSDHVAVRTPPGGLPSFATPGFGKKKPAPLRTNMAADNSIPIIDVSSDESFSAKPPTAHVPNKRLSVESSSDAENVLPPKRVKVESHQKENERPSVRDKGKAREVPSRITNSHGDGNRESSPARSIPHATVLPATGFARTTSTPFLPIDHSDLFSVRTFQHYMQWCSSRYMTI
ncbi:uncharacterized protein LAESUDRAFT_337976 [Laetiporus sulphureus 93-53]|uniref:Uncharacterized protein n=1 Tax=Laetiporus sulphureus 93-53 TaxID=1314785 RepID=A0A165CWE4_9APHY|nr:uncharacterized protein LAESUDRAFT_337976 [Laetiporus sulphureus 93-53]KZT03576.1 hypothetical protein LAESUDRAFT_337976 [Laetiporus sulphureus 93-53]